ncbi:phospholipase D-like domain-containing protein [Caenimonas aquaedulcis]|uniref:Phospholipase D family protein n=1 Tax=Caenimonas aquaedulcis TaxID=2793270 RepID=A0A931H4K7_9BURK|nr:phospholipase D family protein [Caenimonas aquaedulcis]MBG9388524.1 phospholipase D family protein [Caenimonas aquaedulcis]
MQHSAVLTFQPSPRPVRWSALFRALLALVLLGVAAGCASLPANTGRTASQSFTDPGSTSLGRWVNQRRAQDGARADSGFSLLDSVDSAYGSRLALIDGAQRSLDLQYYAIHADNSTEILLEKLRDAARRGVRVRILLDDFNTVGKDAQVLRLAFEPNVEIRLFNPVPGTRGSLLGRIATSLHDMERLQKRMHNKLFLADSAVGITGGRNLGDAYFGGDGNSKFIDLEVLAVGRSVRDMAASFDRYWNDELAYPVQTLMTPQDLDALRAPAAGTAADASRATASAAPASAPASATAPAGSVAASASPTVLPAATQTLVVAANAPARFDLQRLPLTWAPSAVLVDQPGKIGPGDDEADAGETVVDGLLTVMQQARQDVLIVSPYFVPGAQMMKLFADMRGKGVRIRVLTNSLASNDALAAHAGYARYRERLIALGIELYEMRADQGDSSGGMGSGAKAGAGSAAGIGSGAGGGGGSKSGASRASLHSKAVVIDGRLAVIGSMNLDLRSQRKNSEVAVLIRSAPFAQFAAKQITATFADAYRVQMDQGALVWRAPPGASFKDAHQEPEADAKLRLLARLIAPFAPDEML